MTVLRGVVSTRLMTHHVRLPRPRIGRDSSNVISMHRRKRSFDSKDLVIDR
jgi:hypothetical protein